MTSPDIIEVTLKVVKAFERLSISYNIGGSLASSAFGISRATLDVDIVADIRLEQASIISESLKGEFYVDADMIREAIQRRSSFNLIHLDTMFKIDVFVLKDRPYDKQAFSRRVQKKILEAAPQQFYFASPEDIILNKLEWYKNGGEISDRQWNDVLGILKVQGTALDMTYLQHWAKELAISALLQKSLNDAGIS